MNDKVIDTVCKDVSSSSSNSFCVTTVCSYTSSSSYNKACITVYGNESNSSCNNTINYTTLCGSIPSSSYDMARVHNKVLLLLDMVKSMHVSLCQVITTLLAMEQ